MCVGGGGEEGEGRERFVCIAVMFCMLLVL